ncbi:permease of the drug/metabolite transporter (DMT) superfamily [Rubidibacter lacunae KORDI 51-2]|uniref:Permease of the drug/metabolite transporter (DMT) superfamily n=1 Tax=Rubidibacter lacunae KORDI 51-2 TaxID=582515 RepID=U5DP13_9CHRO|nr:EamA family transporter [Rubidibacter lacunae]ERN42349.1 permease of the drug/metabolite transporter (DMT) superfamily [Rubidibacter lacunae KORDI 51-2]
MQLNLSRPQWIASSLFVIAPFFLWGTAMVAMKGVLPQTTPYFVAGVRLVPAGVLVLLVAALSDRPQPRGWLAWCWIGWFALVDGALFQGFLAQGLVRTGAGLGSVTIDSQPLAVALMSSWLFGEAIGAWGWLGLLMGIAGISCVGLPEAWIVGLLHGDIGAIAFEQTGLFDSGILLMLFAALSMAGGTILSRYVSRQVDPVVATGWHMILGGIPLWVLSGLTESQQWTRLDLNGWMALAYATVFGSAIAYGIFFYLAARGSLTSLSALTFLTPVFALAFGSLLLSEELSAVQWSGVGLTLVAIYTINQRDRLTERTQLILAGLRASEASGEELEVVTRDRIGSER